VSSFVQMGTTQKAFISCLSSKKPEPMDRAGLLEVKTEIPVRTAAGQETQPATEHWRH
jgi:hypothetical protein